MMKTLKYIVLLTVMLVNMTPYIKDGKLEWKTTQAAAQWYTVEDLGFGFRLCGSNGPRTYTVISVVNCEDLETSSNNNEPYGELMVKTKTGYPIDENVAQYAGKQFWCAFYSIAIFKDDQTACSIAEAYYKAHNLGTNCLPDIGCDPSDFVDLLNQYGLVIESDLKEKSAIARSLNNGQAVIGTIQNINPGHVVVAHAITSDMSKPVLDWEIHFFDSNNGTGYFYKKLPLKDYPIHSHDYKIAR